MRPTTLRLLLSRILFAAALLFAQQVGVAHAVAHGAGNAPTHQHGKGVPMQGCDECVAFAQVQGGPGSFIVATPPTTDFAVPQTTSPEDWQPAPTRAFSSRAPPFHS